MKRKLIKYHRILGLILSLNFLIICLSGIILVWKDEIDNRNNEELVAQSTLELNDAYSLVSKKVEAKFPNKKIMSIFIDDNNQIQVRVGENKQYGFKGAKREAYLANGILIEKGNDSVEEWTDWLLRLHRQLLLGGKGKYLVGLMGLMLVFVITSGALIIPYFKGLKYKKEKRFKISRIHQKVGALTFSWLLLITFTGIFLALNSLLIGLFLKNNLEMQRSTFKEQKIEIEKYELTTILSKAKAILPEFEVDFISYPDNEFSLPGTYALLLEKKAEQKIMFIESNAALDSRVIELPWYLKLLVVSEPLHFGNYGGIGLKVFWTILGIFAGVIPLTGISNYYYRKLKKKRINLTEGGPNAL